MVYIINIKVSSGQSVRVYMGTDLSMTKLSCNYVSLQILMSVPRVLQDVITYVLTMREDSTAPVILDMQ